jgi:hypothetical protein
MRDAIDEYSSILKMQVVAGHTDEPLYKGQINGLSVGVGFRLRERTEEDHNVVALRVAMMDERHPARRRTERDAIYEQMVADHQGVVH